MKKVQYSYLPAEGIPTAATGKSKAAQSLPAGKKTVPQPTEEMLAKLNAMSRNEYPFSSYIKQRRNTIL